MDEAELGKVSVLARLGVPPRGAERAAWSSTRATLSEFAAGVVGAAASGEAIPDKRSAARLRPDEAGENGLPDESLGQLAPETGGNLLLVPRVL